VVWHQNHSGGF
jgi:hypothetical protein